jgi:hypothetical protein
MLLVLMTSAFADWANCSFKVGGNEFDLSPLRGTTLIGPDLNFTDSRRYKLSVCGNLVHPCIDALMKIPLNGSMYGFNSKKTSPL